MKVLLNLIVMLLPWRLRRLVLVKLYKYDIHPTARIGLSYIYPRHLTMEAGATIGHLNVAIHLESIRMGKNCTISQRNWITGFPLSAASRHFSHKPGRRPMLVIGDESAITKQHHIDCTDCVTIGRFVTIAGYGSQFLTHSIDVYKNRQNCHPISIGDYCFVGTGVKVLGGAVLPPHSVLAAGAVLSKSYSEEWTLYAGVPAHAVKEIPRSAAYFSRLEGYVY